MAIAYKVVSKFIVNKQKSTVDKSEKSCVSLSQHSRAKAVAVIEPIPIVSRIVRLCAIDMTF